MTSSRSNSEPTYDEAHPHRRSTNNYWYIGVVENRRLAVLVAENGVRGTFRLTTVIPNGNETVAGAQEVDLTQEEGTSVLIRGIDRGAWIYAATVVDHGGPLVTTLIAHLFSTQAGRKT
jgi:hypothetical protein